MLEANNDEDAYLRHAGVLWPCLGMGKCRSLWQPLPDHSSRALRIAAVVALRRTERAQSVAIFLKDQDEYIVTEAARAINDDYSIEAALPAVGQSVLTEDRFTSEPLLRRAINACLRVGGEVGSQDSRRFSLQQQNPHSEEMRIEAIAALGNLDQTFCARPGGWSVSWCQLKREGSANVIASFFTCLQCKSLTKCLPCHVQQAMVEVQLPNCRWLKDASPQLLDLDAAEWGGSQSVSASF